MNFKKLIGGFAAVALSATLFSVSVDALGAKPYIDERTPGKDYFPEMHPESLVARAATMQAEVVKRRKAGDQNVFFFDALHEGCGEDFWEGYVDGCHLNDLGFYRLANAICPVVKALL